MERYIHIFKGDIIRYPKVILSIDPAIKNLAVRIEQRNYDSPSSKTILFDKLSLPNSKDGEIYISIINYLNNISNLLTNIDLIIMEKQLPRNYKMVRLSQHILSYFLINNISNCIIEVEPTMKSSVLGYIKEYGNVKKWSIKTALEILNQHNDITGINIINKYSKKDDLADTVCQIEAYIRLIQLMK